jgi:hypothetical protein
MTLVKELECAFGQPSSWASGGKQKVDNAIREPESPLGQLNVWANVHEIYAQRRVRRCWQKLYVARVTGSRVERYGQ